MKKITQPKPAQLVSEFGKGNELCGFYFYFDSYIVNTAWSW